MENKYYTPTIEEFHVGFEYEYEDINEGGASLSWYKGTIKANEAYIIDQLFEHDDLDFRVKLLDREDIDSLGWKMLHEKNFLFNERFCLQINETYIHIHDNSFIGTLVLFNGTIKNKSELQKLMTQLNIK